MLIIVSQWCQNTPNTTGCLYTTLERMDCTVLILLVAGLGTAKIDSLLKIKSLKKSRLQCLESLPNCIERCEHCADR